MKKTIVLFIFALFLLLNITTKDVQIEASSANINDLSCANGKNLMDIDNLFPDNINGTYHLKPMNNIYCPKSDDDGLVFQFTYHNDYFDGPELELILYDIDGVAVQSTLNESDSFERVTIGNQDVYYTVFTIDQSLNPFSFGFIFTGVVEDYVYDNFPGFMITRASEPSEYESYVRRNGLFELSDDSEATIFVSFPKVLSTDNILSLIGARDAYYGDLKDDLEITLNEYAGHESTIGKYRIQVSVSDSSNNSQSGQFFIEVVDIEAPTITGEDVFQHPVYVELDDATILNAYSASDEYDGDISDNMEIIGDYTRNSSTIKDETIQIRSTDSSGNVATKTITIHFYDNVPPVITSPDTLTLSYQVRKSVENILADSVRVTDNLDNNPVLIVVSNNYTGKENKIGTYTIELKAVDVSENISTKTLTVVVEDLVKPVIYIDLGVVETLSSVVLRVEDLNNILYRRGELKRNAKYRTEVLKDTYTGHESTPGTYSMRIRYVSNNESLEKTFTIKVTEASYTVDTYTPKVDITNIVFITTISVLSLALACLIIGFIVKSKKTKRQS